jgi:RHS repeat-associated protein
VQGAGGAGFSWDPLDRLTDVVTGEGRHWHYVYDPLGRRVAKQLLDDYGAVVTQTVFVWEGVRLAEEIADDGPAVTWHWSPSGHRPLARTVGGGAPAAVVTDPVGTPTDLLDEAGAPVWRRRTSFWGVPEGRAEGNAEGATGNGPGCPLGFPGQYLDAETGLYYHVRRYYDPGEARYLSPDPRWLGPAPYAFVAHPLRDVMPCGLPDRPPGGLPGGAAGAIPAVPVPGVSGRRG